MKKILIACFEREMRNMIRKSIKQKLEENNISDYDFDPVDNAEDALDKLQKFEYAILVLDLHISENSIDAYNGEEEHGLTVLKWLVKVNSGSNGNDPLGLVVMLPELSGNDLMRIQNAYPGIKKCCVYKGRKFDQYFNQEIDRLLKIPTKQKTELVIEINLSDKDPQFKIRGAYDSHGKLNIDGNALISATGATSRTLSDIKDIKDREAILANISNKIMYELKKGSEHKDDKEEDFGDALITALAKTDGNPANSKVKFIVDRKFYEVLLESVRYPKKNYWMLEAPVYRAIPYTGTSMKPLFQGEEFQRRKAINCLIINADTHGKKEIGNELRPVVLDEITKASSEAKAIKDSLEQLKAEHGVGSVKVLAPSGGNFTLKVKETLENGQWNIVHFIGHTHYVAEINKAFLFFPGNQNGVEVEDFSQWLRNTNLVYLSSCDSARHGIAFELASNQVPAVCGFRWAVCDEDAHRYAIFFYSSLFKERSIEKAFWMARKHVYEENKNDIFWANPILIQQTF